MVFLIVLWNQQHFLLFNILVWPFLALVVLSNWEFDLKYLLTSTFQMHLMPKTHRNEHTKKAPRTIELNQTHTHAQLVYTNPKYPSLCSHQFSSLRFFIPCSIFVNSCENRLAQKKSGQMTENEWNPNSNHTWRWFIPTFYAPSFVFTKILKYFVWKFIQILIVQQNEKKKKTKTLTPIGNKKWIGNNNLYNKNAEICLWLFLAGAG